jgi:hypothetical protein
LLRFPLGSYVGIVVVQYPAVMRTRQLSAEIISALCTLDENTFEGSLVVLEPGRRDPASLPLTPCDGFDDNGGAVA